MKIRNSSRYLNKEKFDSILAGKEDTIIDIMKIIDTAGLRISLIVDEKRKLQGLVTDGDIRRAILKEGRLDIKISKIMNTDPFIVSESLSQEELFKMTLEKISEGKKKIDFIPIVNEDGILVDAFSFSEAIVAFKERIKLVRDLEAQKNHQEEMYSRELHRKRREIITELLKQYVYNKKFLDIGCAEGMYCGIAKKMGAQEVVGLDISKTKIERAKAKHAECEFYRKDCHNIIKYYNTFDFILCSEVLQHILDYQKFIEESVKCLRNYGYILFSTPNLSHSKTHEFAKVSDKMSSIELLYNIGGAGFGRQNALWKFNTEKLTQEIENNFPLKCAEFIGIDADDGTKNIFTVMLFEKIK